MSGLGTTRVPRPALIPLTSHLAHVSLCCRMDSRERKALGYVPFWGTMDKIRSREFVNHGFRTSSINRSLLLDSFKVKDEVALLVLLPHGFIFAFASWIYRFPFSLKVVAILSLRILDGFQIEYCESCINAG